MKANSIVTSPAVGTVTANEPRDKIAAVHRRDGRSEEAVRRNTETDPPAISSANDHIARLAAQPASSQLLDDGRESTEREGLASAQLLEMWTLQAGLPIGK